MPVSPSAKYFGFSPRPAASYFQDSQSDPYAAVYSGYNPVQSQIEQQQAVDYGDLLAGNTDLDTEEGMSGLQRLLLGGKVSPQQARSAIYGQKYLNPTQRTTAAKGPGRYDPYSPEAGDLMRQVHLLDPSSPTYAQDFQGVVKTAPPEAFTNPNFVSQLDRHQNNISQLRQKQAALAFQTSKPPKQAPTKTLSDKQIDRLDKFLGDYAEEPEGKQMSDVFQEQFGHTPNGDKEWGDAYKLAHDKRNKAIEKYHSALRIYDQNGYIIPDELSDRFILEKNGATQSQPPQSTETKAPASIVAQPETASASPADLTKSENYDTPKGFSGLRDSAKAEVRNRQVLKSQKDERVSQDKAAADAKKKEIADKNIALDQEAQGALEPYITPELLGNESLSPESIKNSPASHFEGITKQVFQKDPNEVAYTNAEGIPVTWNAVARNMMLTHPDIQSYHQAIKKRELPRVAMPKAITAIRPVKS